MDLSVHVYRRIVLPYVVRLPEPLGTEKIKKQARISQSPEIEPHFRDEATALANQREKHCTSGKTIKAHEARIRQSVNVPENLKHPFSTSHSPDLVTDLPPPRLLLLDLEVEHVTIDIAGAFRREETICLHLQLLGLHRPLGILFLGLLQPTSR
jgi:hypothetical protein